MPTVRNALVIGAGIAGLTAAVALRRAGITVDVCEVKTDWSVRDVGLAQPNNALRALGELGLAEPCLALGVALAGWRICDAKGNLLVEVPRSNAAAPQYPPLNGISLPNLHKVLREAALGYEASVHLGRTVAHLENAPDRMDITFSDETKGSYDLVICADGRYSSLRATMSCADRPVTPRFRGEAVWRSNFPRLGEPAWGQLFYGRKSNVRLIPVSPTTMHMMMFTPTQSGSQPSEDRVHFVFRQHLKEFGGTIAAIAAAVDDREAVIYEPVDSFMVPAPWFRGRVVLIGDAAHLATPHLPQGASMAIEDAVVLGQLLQRGRPLGNALSEFMTRRFERCQHIVSQSSQLAEWEKLEWAGQLGAEADPAGLMASSWQKMSEPM